MILEKCDYRDDTSLQKGAWWLGYFGLLPFYMAGVLLLFATDKGQVLLSLQSYAAVILTFAGAIHWGRALTTGNFSLMVVSVVPSLVAWFALSLPPLFGLPTLFLAFVFVWLFDDQQYREIPWFRKLRFQLTTLVCVLLLFAWVITLERVL